MFFGLAADACPPPAQNPDLPLTFYLLCPCADSHCPTWANNLDGHINLRDAVRGTISFNVSGGKFYRLRTDGKVATLIVRYAPDCCPHTCMRNAGAWCISMLPSTLLLTELRATSSQMQNAWNVTISDPWVKALETSWCTAGLRIHFAVQTYR